jgi:hypothetical protein
MAAGRGFLLLLFTAALLAGLASASPFISGEFACPLLRCSFPPRSLASLLTGFVVLMLEQTACSRGAPDLRGEACCRPRRVRLLYPPLC